LSYPDINNLALTDEPMEFTPEADLNPSLLVPDGTYLADITFGKLAQFTTNRDGEPFVDGNGKPYFKVHVSAKIVDPGGKYDGFYVSGFLSSNIRKNIQGESTSEVINMVKGITGHTVPAGTGQATLSAMVADCLANGCQAYIRTRWEALTRNSETDAAGNPVPAKAKWITVKGMKKFPKATYGDGYSPVVEVELADGTITRLEAREAIVDFAPATKQNGAAS
jgi:hypothetical protein